MNYLIGLKDMYLNRKKINNLEAMIMAAGRGKRMSYMTKFLAKPLIKINKYSMLETNIKKLANSGINKIVVNSSYMHLCINKSIKKIKYNTRLPKISITFEKKRLETGGGLKNAINKFKTSELLVINGDSLLHYSEKFCPIQKLYSNFNNQKMDVLLLLSKKKNTLGYDGNGDYKKMNYSFASKLTRENSILSSKYVFTGWQIINKNFVKDFSEKKFSLKKIYDIAEKKGRLYGVLHTGLFFHIGDPKSFNLIKNFINSKRVNLK